MKRASLVLLSLTACAAGVRAPTTAPTVRSAVPVAASFGKTWDALMDVVASQNIPIGTLDRASGIVIAKTSSVSYDKATSYADCGSELGMSIHADRADYSFRVKGDSASSTVLATVHWQHQAAFGVQDCVSKGVWETEAEAAVKAKAEAK